MDKTKILKDNIIVKTNLKIASIIDTQHTSIFKHINQIQDIVAAPITLAVTGEFSAGKSTFINRLLGIDALPVSILPKTATITKLVYGITAKIEIDYFINNQIRTETRNDYKGLKSLQNAKKINEQVFSEEIETIKEIRVYVNNPLLRRFTLMDTPGFNHDVKMDNKTINAIQSANIVIWLSDNSQLAKKTEFDRLKQIKKFVKFIYLVINKADIAIANSDEYKKAYDKTAIFLKDNHFIDFFNASDTYLISCKTNIEFWDGKFQQFLADFGRNVLDNDLDLSINIIQSTWMLLHQSINDEKRFYIKLGSRIDYIKKFIEPENIYEQYKDLVIETFLPFLDVLLSLTIRCLDKTIANTKINSVNEYITEFLWIDVIDTQNSIKPIYDNLFNDIKKSHLQEILDAVKSLISKFPKKMLSLNQNLDIIYKYYNLQLNDELVEFNDIFPLTFDRYFLGTLKDTKDIVHMKSECLRDFARHLCTISHTCFKKVLADFNIIKTTIIEQFSIALKEMAKLKEYNLELEDKTERYINNGDGTVTDLKTKLMW